MTGGRQAVATSTAPTPPDRHPGASESIDVALDRAGRHAGSLGECSARRPPWRVQPELLDDHVLALDERHRLMELHVPGLTSRTDEPPIDAIHPIRLFQSRRSSVGIVRDTHLMTSPLNDAADVRVVPATPDRFDDLAALVGTPDPATPACWCLSNRLSSSEFNRLRGTERPDRLRALCAQDPAPGLLAYLDGKVAGWCSFGPRPALERLMRSRTIPRLDPPRHMVCRLLRRRRARAPPRHRQHPARRGRRLRRRPRSASHRGIPDRQRNHAGVGHTRLRRHRVDVPAGRVPLHRRHRRPQRTPATNRDAPRPQG